MGELERPLLIFDRLKSEITRQSLLCLGPIYHMIDFLHRLFIREEEIVGLESKWRMFQMRDALTITPSSVEVTPLTRSVPIADCGLRIAECRRWIAECGKTHYNSVFSRSDADHKECENPFSPATRPQRNK